jgi:spermidine synthase
LLPSAIVTNLQARTLVFVANAAVLTLEILAGRMMAPFVGVTLETFTGIIGVVLAGIAIGAWLGGHLADRRDPESMLPLAFAIGGATSIATVPLIRTFGTAGLGGGPAAIVFLAGVAFFVPAAVLSAVPPMVVKARLESMNQVGAVVGSLSATGTAGALCGVFVTGFVLIGHVPTTPIMIGTGAAMVCIGAALQLQRHRRGLDDGDGGQRVFSCAVLAAAAGSLVFATPAPCDVETTYFCARVLDDPARPSGRVLMLDDQRHSYVDLDDPFHLEFSYGQAIGGLIDVIAEPGAPLDVVHVGGGGFTLARYVRVTRPGSRNQVFELDPGLVGLAQRELGLDLGDDILVTIGDARLGVRSHPPASADLVIGDAFGGEAVPWHLTTREFVQSVHDVMRPTAAYVVNLIDRPPLAFVRAEVATLRAEFAHVAIIAPSERIEGTAGGNFVVVASDAPLPVDALRGALTRRGTDHVVVDDVEGLDRFTNGSRPLTDEFAPVDQLMTTLD